MKMSWQCTVNFGGGIVLAATLLLGLMADAADQIQWRKADNRVDAEIGSWQLPRLLEELAGVTDWQIYVEPNTYHTVSTKFKNRPPGEALRLLLGDLSFALLPQTNGPATLFVFRTSPQEATVLVRPPEKSKASAKTGKPIPNELIVTLKPGANIDELARKLGAKVVGRSDGQRAYRLQFEDEAATSAARELLKDNPDVESVDSNFLVSHEPPPDPLAVSYTPPMNLKPRAVGDANHVVVGLIDTAVGPQGGTVDQFMLPSLSVVGDGKTADPQNLTHGDSMSQVLLRGLSTTLDNSEGTRVRILPVDVYGSSSSTTTFDVARGIFEAVNSGATIINLSLGSDGDADFMHRVIISAHEQGVLFFAAAGNRPTTVPTYPAAYPEVVAVTAGTSNGQLASYANRGDFVDAVAPGSTIVSYQGKSYLVSGTSAASAFAAGAAAGLADDAKKKLAEVEAAIRQLLAPKK